MKTAQEIASRFNLKRLGSEYRGNCPICQAKKLELSVWDKPEGIGCHCFYGCDPRSLFQVLVGLDSFRPASKLTAKGAMRNEGVKRLWDETMAAKGTLVETYLQSRGITLPMADSIRLHPHCKHKESEQWFPALIARIDDAKGELVAIQRIYLDLNGKRAGVEPVKKTLGSFRAGMIRLSEPDDTLCLAEGLETSLSVLQMTGVATWATVSAGNMKNIVPPPTVKTVYLMADNDPPGIKAAEETAKILARSGLTVNIAIPPTEGTDWNDFLVKESVS